MSINAAHASAFYDEVLANGEVWAIRDVTGFPAPENAEGHRAMPFWSLRSRAERIITSVDAYRDFEAEAIPLDVWRSRWLGGLGRESTPRWAQLVGHLGHWIRRIARGSGFESERSGEF